MRDGHACRNANQLQSNVEEDLTPSNTQHRLVALDEAFL
jgi:hypothetical protein